MRLYSVKIPDISKAVIEELVKTSMIEVEHSNREEAELDLVAIMEEYRRRDSALRESVREHMSRRSVPYDQYGRVRGQMAEEWGHPTGDAVEKFLARQFVENFMISRFIEEVYGEDRVIYKKILEILVAHDVDERAIREEAKDKIRNIPEGTVDYEIALSGAIKEVKKRYGLIR